MLSLDGADHARHREPFAHPFRPARVRDRFTGFIEAETDRLISVMRPAVPSCGASSPVRSPSR
jgi:cytochrome P450